MQIRNYPSLEAARCIVKKANSLIIGAEFTFKRSELTESDRRNGVGAWAVHLNCDDTSYQSRGKADDVLTQAETLVLADALLEAGVKHPVLESWWINPENHGSIVKTKFGRSSLTV